MCSELCLFSFGLIVTELSHRSLKIKPMQDITRLSIVQRSNELEQKIQSILDKDVWSKVFNKRPITMIFEAAERFHILSVDLTLQGAAFSFRFRKYVDWQIGPRSHSLIT